MRRRERLHRQPRHLRLHKRRLRLNRTPNCCYNWRPSSSWYRTAICSGLRHMGQQTSPIEDNTRIAPVFAPLYRNFCFPRRASLPTRRAYIWFAGAEYYARFPPQSRHEREARIPPAKSSFSRNHPINGAVNHGREHSSPKSSATDASKMPKRQFCHLAASPECAGLDRFRVRVHW
jgi:hypothetical protein